MKNTRPRCEAPAPLEVELLIPPHKRRVTVDDHLDFHAALRGPAQAKKEGEASRIIDLLDEIGGEG